jgi:hypothetical protein
MAGVASSVRFGKFARDELCGARGCVVRLAESARADVVLIAKTSGLEQVEDPVARALRYNVTYVRLRDWGEGRLFEAIGPVLARARRVYWMADLSPFGAMMGVLVIETLAKVGARGRFLGISDSWLDALGRARGCEAWVEPVPEVGAGGPRVGIELSAAELRFARRIFRESPELAELYGPRCTRMLLDGTSLELEAFCHEPARRVISGLLKKLVTNSRGRGAGS